MIHKANPHADKINGDGVVAGRGLAGSGRCQP